MTDMATQRQLDFIGALRTQIHLSKRLLDNHSHRTFGCGVEDLSKGQASLLIEEMQGWATVAKTLPPVIQREAGQVDLPGFGS